MLKIIWLKSSHNQRVIIIGLSEVIWTKSLGQNENHHENAAWLLSTVQNGGNDVKFLASL